MVKVALRGMRTFLLLTLPALPLAAQQHVTFPLSSSGVQLQADLYGTGKRALVLAHGGRFDKESWSGQAKVFAEHGFLVLALRFRGDGPNPDGSAGSYGSPEENAADVRAAVEYLHRIGATSVDALGGSLGGDAVGEADTQLPPRTFAHTIMLASNGADAPERLTGRILYIVAQDDTSGDGPRLPGIQAHFARTPEPKKLVILKGSAHAQFLFDTDEGPRLMQEILAFLR